ncbi:hypothetical protein [Dactylosporangium sp. NPDC005555]|uniref:hypothetical protein n=1 Tax=Dactylosporangium sp. NPDC005555 TaxID=3154889 RepID=UPI0033A54954
MNFSEIFGPIVTLVLAIGAGLFSLNNVRRTDFERVRQLHADLTTGPVSEARHVVGTAFDDPARGDHVQLTLAELEALYIVLWSFERIDVARDTLLGRWRWLPRAANPRRTLDASVKKHVRMYLGYLDRAYVGQQKLVLRTDSSEAGILRLARRIGLHA